MIGYLSGPIAGCNEEEKTEWREQLKIKFPEIQWLDPCRRTYADGDDYKSLVRSDLEDIDNSDIVVINYWKTGTGTAMELAYVFHNTALSIVYVPEDMFLSPWILYHSDIVVRTWDELEKVISEQFAAIQ